MSEKEREETIISLKKQIKEYENLPSEHSHCQTCDTVVPVSRWYCEKCIKFAPRCKKCGKNVVSSRAKYKICGSCTVCEVA